MKGDWSHDTHDSRSELGPRRPPKCRCGAKALYGRPPDQCGDCFREERRAEIERAAAITHPSIVPPSVTTAAPPAAIHPVPPAPPADVETPVLAAHAPAETAPAAPPPALVNPNACRYPHCTETQDSKRVRGLHKTCYTKAGYRGILNDVALPPQIASGRPRRTAAEAEAEALMTLRSFAAVDEDKARAEALANAAEVNNEAPARASEVAALEAADLDECGREMVTGAPWPSVPRDSNGDTDTDNDESEAAKVDREDAEWVADQRARARADQELVELKRDLAATREELGRTKEELGTARRLLATEISERIDAEARLNAVSELIEQLGMDPDDKEETEAEALRKWIQAWAPRTPAPVLSVEELLARIDAWNAAQELPTTSQVAAMAWPPNVNPSSVSGAIERARGELLKLALAGAEVARG